MIRPMYGQLKNPMMKTSMAIRRLTPDRPNARSGMTPTSASEKSSSGKARKTSMSRPMKASIQPPKYPEMTPMTVPMTIDMAVARNALSSDTREQQPMRLNRWPQLLGFSQNSNSMHVTH